MRIVPDTNVVVSALLWRGTPHRLREAFGARPSFLVSGDRHLLALGTHHGIRMITPADALRLIAVS